MPVYYAIGDALVNDEELIEARATGKLKTFAADLKAKGQAAAVEFSTGKATGANLNLAAAPGVGGTTAFTPIGMGKPLAVEVRHLYTGLHPEPGVFRDRPKDMMLSSAVKAPTVTAPAPRAINLLREGVNHNSDISTVAATEPGTPLVYYVPALTEPAQVVTLEMIFDMFPQDLFTMAGRALTQAAGIPIFAPASGYLMAAGMIINIIGRIGEKLFDGRVALRVTDQLAFDRPGSEIPRADFRLLVMENFDPRILQTHAVRGGKLVNTSTGAPYAGDHPYAVVSLDGAEKKAYEAFRPTAVSAVLLERFYHVGGQGQPLDPLVDALKVYNDLQFYQRAKDAKGRRDAITDTNSDAYKKADADFQALRKNVLTQEFKDLS
jgi:hypothetical protein